MTEPGDVRRPRRLVLLANQYPFPTGDASFIRPELPALLDAFDEVVVANYERRADDPEPLPDRVRYLGNLYGASRAAQLRAVLRPRALRILLGALRRERGSTAGWRRQLGAGLVGLTLASDPRLRAVVDDPAAAVTVAAFWGMGAGLALPWLPGRAGRSVRLHRYDLYESAEHGLPLRRTLFGAADRILCISEEGAQHLRERYGALVADRLVLARLGTADPGGVRPAARTGRVEIASCSTLTENKRVGLIAEAAAAIAAGGRAVRWVHFGDGPLEAQLRDAVARRPVPGLEVEWRGRTPNAEIVAHYLRRRVDVFVNASRSEGVPVSIMEALSCGIPAVATDAGGTREIVGEEHGSGILVPVDVTPAGLAAAIVRAADAPDGVFDARAAWSARSDARAVGRATARLLAGLAR